MDALVVIAAGLAFRVVVQYFGVLAGTTLGSAYLRVSAIFVLPLGLSDVRSLYGGSFDANAALTVIICLIAEFGLARWRDRI